MLVQVVYFLPIKLFCESSVPTVCNLLCAFMCGADKDGDNIHLPAKPTDCWIVQAVLSVGRQAAHKQHPGIQQYQSK